MAATYSFDVTSNIDMPEVDNAVNQARKEIGQRFDFKGSIAAIDLDQKANTLTLTAEDNFKLESVWDVLQTRLIKRNVPVKNMKRGDIEPAAGSTVKQVITLQQGIPSEAAKDIVKHLKDLKLKKVQASIQGDQVRITLAVEGRPAGRDAGAARQGLRGRAPVWQLPLGPPRGRPRNVVSLERALSKLGLASRSEARALILQGRVTVDGTIAHQSRRPASSPSASTIAIDGAATKARRRTAHHRPAQAARLRHDAIGSRRPQDDLRPARRSARARRCRSDASTSPPAAC